MLKKQIYYAKKYVSTALYFVKLSQIFSLPYIEFDDVKNMSRVKLEMQARNF